MRILLTIVLMSFLLLPTLVRAGGNTYGGGGGGISTDPLDPISTNGTDLFLNTPGASFAAEPAADTGAAMILPSGTNDGGLSFTLKINDDGLLSAITCEITTTGTLSGYCPFTWPASTWGLDDRAVFEVAAYSYIDDTIWEDTVSGCHSTNSSCYIPLKRITRIFNNQLGGIAYNSTLDDTTPFPANEGCSGSVFPNLCSNALTLQDIDPTTGRTTWQITVHAITGPVDVGRGTAAANDCSIQIWEDDNAIIGADIVLPNGPGSANVVTREVRTTTPADNGESRISFFAPGGRCHNSGPGGFSPDATLEWKGTIYIEVVAL